MDIRLSAIHLYPVKGARGVAVDRAVVEAAGLRHDRRWIIVDEQGKFISQRSHPRLALVSARWDDRILELAAPERESLTIEAPDGKSRLEVAVWRDLVDAAAADPRADRWLSAFMDHPCRLAYMDVPGSRPVSSSAGRPGDTVSFADGYPLLLASVASLEDLNSRLDEPLPMDRFRPNLVVEGCEAFAEDRWSGIAIGEAVFRFAGPCSRCSVTTVDQAAGTRTSEEPLRTLLTYRQTAEGVIFGVNLIPEKTGVIETGAVVTAME